MATTSEPLPGTGPRPVLPEFPEQADVASLRGWLKDCDQALHDGFDAGAHIVRLVRTRATVVDRLLQHLWQIHLDGPGRALVAVGGYGRLELHPYSDVDVMVLHRESDPTAFHDALSAFFTALWDLRLDLGHSVRTIADCVREAENDVTVATNLMEARRVAGDGALFEAMRDTLAPPKVWPGRAYFEAKLSEQVARHHRYDDTVYNLEPNVKKGLGGLRDIQMVGWVARRHYGVEALKGLVDVGFLDGDEYQSLREGLLYLWRVRWTLHRLAGRSEDRLLFDHQRDLARAFGFRDEKGNLAVEQFMHQYFRTVMHLERMNERLLQAFEEDILSGEDRSAAEVLSPAFRLHKGYIEAIDDGVFERDPVTLIELFEWLQRRPTIKGVRAATTRAIRRSLDVIDQDFRGRPDVRDRFIGLLRGPGNVPELLARMHRYGVLGRYLPAFAQIEGRMQYDLFHVYTVDQHTLFVLRNLYRFAVAEEIADFPLVDTVYERIERPEVLYLAGLFHDIAKGRGGDHSELGEKDAESFCKAHGVADEDTRLICWLVRHHLLMSVTAQRQDISDPEVVNRFARQVGDPRTLDHLYLLTLADISATSPKLWNSWRAALMSELYRQTADTLARGLDNAPARADWVEDSRQEARRLLLESGMAAERLEALWAPLPDDYFLRVAPEQIAWQARQLDRAGEGACLAIRQQTDRGSTEVFVHLENIDGTFATLVATLGNMGLNIVDARVFNTADGNVLDTFQVLDQQGRVIDDPRRVRRIREALRKNLAQRPLVPPEPDGALPRRLSHFVRAPRIRFTLSRDDPRTMLELKCSDRPGLLARVARVLLDHGVRVHGARIATYGERVEDYFLLSDQGDRPLGEAIQSELAEAIVASLSEGMPAAVDADSPA